MTVTGSSTSSGDTSVITTSSQTVITTSSATVTGSSTSSGDTSVITTSSQTVITTSSATAPTISSVTDNVSPVTGALTNGASTNDTDLLVTVSVSGTGAVAGDTIQLYNGSSPLGSAYTLQAADITNGFADVQTGTLSNGTTYTITARISDAAGNQSNASAAFTVTEDTTAPTAPTISAVTDDVGPVTGALANGASTDDSDLTVRVSVSGTGAVAGDTIQLYDGASALGSAYTLTDSDITNGFADVQTGTLSNGTTYTITARVTDAAGNQSSASAAFTVTENTTAPTVSSVTMSDTALKIGDTSTVTITFSEAVTGFDNSDVTVANGTLSTLSSADGGVTWTATFTPTANIEDTTNVVTVAATYTDLAGNAGSGLSSANYTIDTHAPTVSSVTMSDTALKIGDTSTVTITFSEAVTGFDNSDVTVANGTLSTLSSADGGVTWTATFTPTANIEDTTNVVTVAATYTDLAGNAGSGLSSANYTIDTHAPTAPTISAVTDDVGPVTGALANGASTDDSDLTVRVSVSGTGAVAGDTIQLYDGASALGSAYTLTDSDITNGFADVQTGTLSNGTTYTITARVTDAAGNQSSASAAFTVTENTTGPTVSSVTMSDTALKIGDTSTVTITFSEAVTGFDNSDVTVANGTLSTLSSADGGVTWTATFTPTANIEDTTNVVTVAATYTDLAGNAGSGLSSANYTIDTHAPTVSSVTMSDTALKIGDTSTVTITFSEAVTGFDNSDVTVANGTLSTLSSADGGVTWTATFTPTANIEDTTNVVTVAATYTDLAGNAGSGLSSANYTIDTHAPTAPTISAVTDDVGPVTGALANGASTDDSDLTVRVSVSGTGAVAGDTIQLYDGASALGSAYTLTDSDITNGFADVQTGTLSNGTTYTITARVTDAAGNQSSASAAFTVTENTTAPMAVATVTALSSDTGTVGDFITTVAPQTVSGTYTGTLGSDEKIQVSVDGGTTWIDATAVSGTWSASGLMLSVGVGTLLVRTIDTAGNTTAGTGQGYTLTLTGDNNDNTLIGTLANDTIQGLGGNDVLQGLAGDDLLDGGAGLDRAIYTDATGPITVDMAAGTVSGAGVGNDTLVSVESIRGSAFNDTYVATGYAGASAIGSVAAGFNEFEGMAGNDVITGNGSTILSYLNATGAVTVDIAAGIATGDASVGTDTFTGVQGVRGSGFDDTLLGSNNAPGTPEVFQGRGGNDFIDGRGGFDRVIYGFRTDDNVTGGITVNLAAGTVVGDASVGTDTLRSIEAVRGTSFADSYNASGFTTTNVNGPNFGSAGFIVIGGVQEAFNEFEGLGGNDTITGNGNTRISYINATDGVTVDLALTTVTGSTGIAYGTVAGDVAGIGTDTIFGGVNSIVGSSFADTLSGSDNAAGTAETFDGGAGNDTIDGRGGFDQAVYNGDLGTAAGISVDMAAGTVTGDASIGNDTLLSIEAIRGTNFNDTYDASKFTTSNVNGPNFGTAGFITINGIQEAFNDFEGMGGNDTITGNGNTRISYLNAAAGVTVTFSGPGSGTAQSTASGDIAGVGVDTFTGVNAARGSNFADTFIMAVKAVNDTRVAIDGSGGSDTVNYSAYTTALTVTLNGGAPVIVHGSGSDDAHSDTIANVENVVGGSGNDIFVGDANNNVFTGGGGDDAIAGGAGLDRAIYQGATGHIAVDMAAGTVVGDPSVGTDTLRSIEAVRGTNFDDIYNATGFTTSSTNAGSAGFINNGVALNEFEGMGGDDTITGNGNTRISFINATAGVTVDLAAGTRQATPRSAPTRSRGQCHHRLKLRGYVIRQ